MTHDEFEQLLIASNADRWKKMAVRPRLVEKVKHAALRLCDPHPSVRGRYLHVAASTDVPWFVIAVIHEREASQNWADSIAQGDPWSERSVHVPRGRGPFGSWEEAALDALLNCAPYAGHWRDWSVGGTLTLLEMYNGLGYAHRGLASPYVWASTDKYVAGKYLSDGHFDAHAVDQQIGCAALLLEMIAYEPGIKFAE